MRVALMVRAPPDVSSPLFRRYSVWKVLRDIRFHGRRHPHALLTAGAVRVDDGSDASPPYRPAETIGATGQNPRCKNWYITPSLLSGFVQKVR
ncbi:MAG: hypothetical protein OHK0015_45340 [Chloroflexi bacterium OHK40]